MKKISVFAGLLLGAQLLPGAILTYTSRPTWEASLPGAVTWSVDFSGFAADASFETSAVDAGPFSLAQVGTRTFRNLVEVTPFEFTDNNGTAHASMFTNYGEVTVNLTFDAPVSAFGANFYGVGGTGELLDLVLNFQQGGSLTLSPSFITAGSFAGFGATAGELVSSITFVSRTDNPGLGGEGFGMDDVAGYSARGAQVPEPGSLGLMLAGLAAVSAGAWRRRQR